MRKVFFSVALLLLSGPVCAQVYPWQMHEEKIDSSSKVGASHNFGEFGDATDYSSGATLFRKVVVEIPGSSNLRVAADYIVKPEQMLGGSPPEYFITRDIPYIEGTHSSDYGWIAGKAPDNFTENRCSDSRAVQGAALVRIGKPVDVMVPDDYWSGNSLYTPSAGGGIIRHIFSGEPRPSGVDIRFVTNDGWRFSCYVLQDGSEGFIGHRQNGEKYYFGVPVAMGQDMIVCSPDFADCPEGLHVDRFRMYLTRIEDRFGNWVNYGPNQITSNDGRTITFVSDPALGGTIVQAEGRQWVISGNDRNFSITNPDGSTWSFVVAGGFSMNAGYVGKCWSQSNIPSTYSGQLTVTVKTESGATGRFVFQPRRHGYSHVSYSCVTPITGGKEQYSQRPNFIDEVALVSRDVSGPGIVNYSHAIDYGLTNACYAQSWAEPPDVCTPNSPTTRTTTITGSDGSVRTLTFGNRFNQDAGLLLGESEGELMKTTSFENISLSENSSGFGKRALGYDVNAFRVYRMRKVTTTQQGRKFTMEVPSTCGADGVTACFDSFFRPTRVIRSSAPSP